MIFEAHDWNELATLFKGVALPAVNGTCPVVPYAGYKPNVTEAPNGDTRECDRCDGVGTIAEPVNGSIFGVRVRCPAGCDFGRVPNVAPPTTRYLHVAPKYSPPAWATAYLARAHYEACRVAEALGVPAAYYPRVADGTLRVLDYDVGGSQPEHTDPDLFTVLCYRSAPDDLEVMHRHTVTGDLAEAHRRVRGLSPEYAKTLHVGELGELVGLGPATPHRVPARPYRQQSIVYFAMPDHAVRLPCAECGAGKMWACRAGQTVGEWLKERLARSRVYK